MAYFYSKNGEAFIPEAINPQFSKLAMSIVKTTKTSFKFKLKATAIENAIKSGDKAQMLSIMQKCFEKNKQAYENDMALSGVKLTEFDDSFFEDKDIEFFKNQLRVLIDFAYINTVIESRLMGLMAASCEKLYGKKLDEIFFFTNQDEILKDETEETEEEAE